MRRLVAVAVVVVGVALPVCAQRGGGARGGAVGHSGGGFSSHGGGFSSRGGGFSTPAFRGSVSPMARVGLMGVPQFSGSRYALPNTRLSGAGAAPVTFNRRPGYPVRRGGDDRYRRPYGPVYGVGLPYAVGWAGSDCLAFSDCGYYDDSAYASQTAPAYGPVSQDPGPQDAGPQYGAPPSEQAEAAPESFRPAYQRPQPEPAAEDAVTLIFKDGRPAEQIHNYMLTRTTLYVQDEHRREIPVDQLDLAATVKANKDVGVDFQLPGGGRSQLAD